MRMFPVLGGAIAAAVLPLSISFSSGASPSDVVRLNNACAAESGRGCKFNLLHICETEHNDHRFYRNLDGGGDEPIEEEIQAN